MEAQVVAIEVKPIMGPLGSDTCDVGRAEAFV